MAFISLNSRRLPDPNQRERFRTAGECTNPRFALNSHALRWCPLDPSYGSESIIRNRIMSIGQSPVAWIGRLASGAGRRRRMAPSLTLGPLLCRSKKAACRRHIPKQQHRMAWQKASGYNRRFGRGQHFALETGDRRQAALANGRATGE
jgi:hypothetical protein